MALKKNIFRLKISGFQVSPPIENIITSQSWFSYLAVSYALGSR
jgi:hypothetical protein